MQRDIPINVNLQEMFKIPECAAIALPEAKSFEIRLPHGGSLKAIADLSKGIPTDCSLSANLMLQLAPFLASIECLLKVLALLKPLIDIIKGLSAVPPDLGKVAEAVPGFIDAAAKIVPCFGMLIPVTIFPFIKDLLLALIKIIKCVIGQLESVLAIMQGIEIRLGEARAAGNTELEALLECARANAQTSAEHASQGMGPVMNLMELVQPFMEIAGIELKIEMPGDVGDSQALSKAITALKDTVTTIEQLLETLP